MASPDFLGRGWSFPIKPAARSLAVTEDDEKIRQSILLILETPKGERVMEPDFGCDLHQLVFAASNESLGGLAADYVTSALAAWEPRIDVEDVSAAPDPNDPQRLNIDINYVVRSKNSIQNLVYPFYLNRP